ncbi:MAG TPA: transposase [Methylophaga aminisulfidivorans]|uniref:Transposase n=1 Tax=Methylophaga aminisulfidivorans TaxID=230105 RepID=A0A7C1W4A0_9GAMM|nr:transposase [Methylophaga aminisulfidivorans]
MPRRARVYIPEHPYHLVQRGNNRDACFFDPENYQYYLELLTDKMPRYGVALHAYVLMTNHIHLLLTPSEPDSISRLMKVVGSRYAYYINKTYRRSGTVWEGRHKSSLIDADNYLLKCYRYIEMNPVEAKMVKRPEEYKWSSYCVNAWGKGYEQVTPHYLYGALGATLEERSYRYRELFKINLDDKDIHVIRNAAHYCQPTGDSYFKESIERQIGRKLGYAKRGRPTQSGLNGG